MKAGAACPFERERRPEGGYLALLARVRMQRVQMYMRCDCPFSRTERLFMLGSHMRRVCRLEWLTAFPKRGPLLHI